MIINKRSKFPYPALELWLESTKNKYIYEKNRFYKWSPENINLKYTQNTCSSAQSHWRRRILGSVHLLDGLSRAVRKKSCDWPWTSRLTSTKKFSSTRVSSQARSTFPDSRLVSERAWIYQINFFHAETFSKTVVRGTIQISVVLDQKVISLVSRAIRSIIYKLIFARRKLSIKFFRTCIRIAARHALYWDIERPISVEIIGCTLLECVAAVGRIRFQQEH